MAKDDYQFLSGAALSDRIRRVCDAPAVDCAVAFWGRDMRDTLFTRWSEQTVRIVCDIAMQGTPRAALEQLDAPNNELLKVCDGLHAKVFISSAGAVIGSANASMNGVGRTAGKAGELMEAGIFCPPGSKGFKDATDFFVEKFSQARKVNQDDLDRAPISTREPHLPVTNIELDGMSLIERLRQHPNVFSRTSIALTTGQINPKVIKARVAAHNKEARKEDRISRDDIFVHGGRGDTKDMDQRVLLIHKEEGGRGSVTGYVDVRPYPLKRPDIGIGTASWSSFCKKVGQPGLKKKLSSADWRTIETLMENDEWLFTAERFAELLRD